MALERALAYWFAKNYDGLGGSWLDEVASFDATLPGGTNDPTFNDHDGTNFFRFPGLTGNNLSLADSTDLDIGASDFDMRLRMSLDDWTPAGNMRFYADKLAGPNRGIWFNILVAGTIQVVIADGSSTEFLESSESVPLSGVGWIRIASVSGTVTYYTSTTDTNDPDAVSWTQLGTTDTRTLNPASVVATVRIGRAGHVDNNRLLGTIYRLRLDIGGTVELDINAADEDGDTVTQAGTFAESSVNAATVTINQSGTAELMRLIDRAEWEYNTDDYHEVATAAALNFTHTDPFVFGLAFRTYDTSPSADAALMAKKADFTTADGYALYLESGDATAKAVVADGSNDDEIASGNLTAGKAHTLLAVFDGSTLEIVLDGVGTGSPVSKTVAADMANAVGLRFGALSGGSYGQVSIFSAALFDELVPEAQWPTLHTELLTQVVIPSGQTMMMMGV